MQRNLYISRPLYIYPPPLSKSRPLFGFYKSGELALVETRFLSLFRPGTRAAAHISCFDPPFYAPTC